MNDYTQRASFMHRRQTPWRSLYRYWARLDPLSIFLVVALLAADIGVMIVTRQPMIGLAFILGIPVLLLFWIYPKCVVYILIVYSLIVKFLVSDVGIGGIANYVCDGLLVIALLLATIKQKHTFVTPGFRTLDWGVFAFWTVATLSAVAHGVSFGLYIWACRNTFRLFGILYCCVKLLDNVDIDRLIKFVFGFFFVNVVVCTYQHFVLGVGQDNTNGLFGTASGGNAMMNVLLFGVCAFSLFGFLQNEYHGWLLALVLTCSCYLAAIAELKFFYFELVVLVILALVSQRFSLKTILSAVALVIIIAIGIRVLIIFNPRVADFFNWDEILHYSGEGGYSDPNNLNRMTAIRSLDERFLTTMGDKLFGLGFGAGQFTQFFASPLYAAYGFVLNWNFFTDAAIFLETGYIGLILYILLFVFIAIFSLGSIRTITTFENKSLEMGTTVDAGWIDRACASVSFLCILLIFYNSTLTTDPGCYFVGFILSFPFIIDKSLQQKEISNV